MNYLSNFTKNEASKVLDHINSIMNMYVHQVFGFITADYHPRESVKLLLEISESERYIKILYMAIALFCDLLITDERYEIMAEVDKINKEVAKIIHKRNKTIDISPLLNISSLEDFAKNEKKKLDSFVNQNYKF